MSTSILIFGTAFDLLHTRQLVLQHAGFEVTVALSFESVTQHLTASPFDLFVLCHSLSSAVCQRALEQAHSRYPAMKNLILCKALSDRPQPAHDAYLNEFVSPRTLIAAARELTTTVEERV